MKSQILLVGGDAGRESFYRGAAETRGYALIFCERTDRLRRLLAASFRPVAVLVVVPLVAHAMRQQAVRVGKLSGAPIMQPAERRAP